MTVSNKYNKYGQQQIEFLICTKTSAAAVAHEIPLKCNKKVYTKCCIEEAFQICTTNANKFPHLQIEYKIQSRTNGYNSSDICYARKT